MHTQTSPIKYMHEASCPSHHAIRLNCCASYYIFKLQE